jgi:serine/threonine protein kinase
MFGSYEVLERRDVAGDGLDILATDPEGREVRLWAGAPDSAARGPVDELRAVLARVYHTGLPRVLGSEEIDGRAVLRLQPYRGPTLAQRLEEGPMSAPEAIDVARSCAAALVKAHAKGLVHGAITSEEIVLSEDGRTLLLRVGFGPYLGPRPRRAPEDETGAEAADVFALSRALVQALEGRDPYDVAVSFAEAARDEHGFDPALPQGLRRLLARAISPDPARRMVRAEELAGDLGVIRASWDTMAQPPRAPRAGRALRIAGWVAGAVVLLLALRWLLR